MMKYKADIQSPEILGRVLQQARLVHGYSQREMAKRLGVSQRYIWELESGTPSIAMTRLFAAMRETGMSLYAELETPNDS